MQNFSSTYRKIWVAGVLLFYLVASVQFSLLEGLHFLAHLKNGCTGTGVDHSYFQHMEQGHHHNSLTVFELLIDAFPDEEMPVNNNNKQDIKKNPQLLSESPNLNAYFLSLYKIPHSKLSDPSNCYPSVPTPPPRYS